MKTGVHILWFKRDVRVHDSPALAAAAHAGAVLPLFIIEPSLLHAPDFAPSHWTFLRQSLCQLREQLAALGQPLVVRVGEVTDVLEALLHEVDILGLWSHEETGNALTYQRDLAVGRWAKAHTIAWHEIPQTGVVRRLKSRDSWAASWEQFMRAPQAIPPPYLSRVDGIEPGPIPDHGDLGLLPDTRSAQQMGGEAEALALLGSFLVDRGQGYQRAMSSPLSAWDTCSRLSPHLAWGTLSLRRTYQEVLRRQEMLHHLDNSTQQHLAGPTFRDLASFASRLHWRSHFMQKLEDEPRIEFENMVHAYDGLREDVFRRDWFEAWCQGRTGYPLIDACIRAVQATGYLNFRMRALLVSFASYDLWLHWREPGVYLARQWLDYEPGIHYAQMQMQSGTTGINTVRIYNPTKQAKEQDPEGVFIRRWVSELEGVASTFIHTPWLMPTQAQHSHGCVLGKDYPWPIVDHEMAARAAHTRIAHLRQQATTQNQARRVLLRHGSRTNRRKRLKALRPAAAEQLMLDCFAQSEDE